MTERFYCPDCELAWRDEYTFWHGYTSACPNCGLERKAVIDASYWAFDLGAGDPLPDDFERSEEDLEAERDTIKDEISEALGAADADEDADPDGSEGDGSEGDGDE